MRTAKTLIRLDGCPGWSKSSLGAHSFCWFCHVAAQFCFLFRLIQSEGYDLRLCSSCADSFFFLKLASCFHKMFMISVSFIFLLSPKQTKENCWNDLPAKIFKTRLSLSMTKPTKWHVRQTKTQISLSIRQVWSVSLLSAWGCIWSLA